MRSKSILLVDSNRQNRELRAKAMRTHGVQVDCVTDADAARVRLAAGKYNLILVDPGNERESAESLVQEIRANNSRQLVRFLVGSPLFIAKSLTGGSSPAPLVELVHRQHHRSPRPKHRIRRWPAASISGRESAMPKLFEIPRCITRYSSKNPRLHAALEVAIVT